MQATDTWAAKGVRGLVKTIFIGCYLAFMWASIHHVAAFFNDFEADSSNSWGSYLLAGAFDITALVTTIGVMFFRKSMPAWVFWIVWTFIIAIAGYSFFINWEYASHYQNLTLLLQPTGATTAVYDRYGVLHYVPVMQVNTRLLWMNPILASGFTIFSLIYSVIAEFFGTKAPTVEELLAKKTYLEETASVVAAIRTLEEKHRKPSLIQRAKEAAKEVRIAVKEVRANAGETEDDGAGEQKACGVGDGAGGHATPQSDETTVMHPKNAGGHAATNAGNGLRKTSATEKALAGSGERLSVTVKEAAVLLNLSESYVRELRAKHTLRSPGRNKKLILLSSIHCYQNEHQKAGEKVGEASSHTTASQRLQNDTGNGISPGNNPLYFSEYAAK